MKLTELLQFLICHQQDIGLLYLPLLRLQGKASYHQVIVTKAMIFAWVKRNFLTFQWVGPFSYPRVALVFLVLSYLPLLGASQLHRRYLVEPAIQYRQQLAVEQAVVEEKLKHATGSGYAHLAQAHLRNEKSIRMTEGWIAEDKRYQAGFSGIIWMVGKLIGLCFAPLLSKD